MSILFWVSLTVIKFWILKSKQIFFNSHKNVTVRYILSNSICLALRLKCLLEVSTTDKISLILNFLLILGFQNCRILFIVICYFIVPKFRQTWRIHKKFKAFYYNFEFLSYFRHLIVPIQLVHVKFFDKAQNNWII